MTQPKPCIRSYIGLLFQRKGPISWEDLIKKFEHDILEKLRAMGIDINRHDLTLVSIEMPCGTKVDYKTAADIPRRDTPCPCGDETHWLVMYREIPPDGLN